MSRDHAFAFQILTSSLHFSLSFIVVIIDTGITNIMTSAARPQILLLSLAYWSAFDDTYTTFIDKLSASAQIKRAKNPNAAIRFLDDNTPKTIVITDQGLNNEENKNVLDRVVSYVRDGGTVVVGFHFPNFTNGDEFEAFFKAFELPWAYGDYHRTDFGFNPACALPANVLPASFPAPYSMKVLHVDKARPEEKMFVPVDGARIQSHVFAPVPVSDPTQAAVAGAKIGEGYLVYVGDVNPETGSAEVVLRFCGL